MVIDHLLTRWFQRFFIFTPTWGRFPIWRAYFSNGLKLPTRYKSWDAPPSNSYLKSKTSFSRRYGKTQASKGFQQIQEIGGSNGWFLARWSQLKYFLGSPLTLGLHEPIWRTRIFFKLGWFNHQPFFSSVCYFERYQQKNISESTHFFLAKGNCDWEVYTSFLGEATNKSMGFPGSLNRWDRWYKITQLAVYTTYIYHL